MLRIARLSTVALLLLSSLPAQGPWQLPEGTPVRLRINRTISSENCQIGDNVDFESLDDIRVNGQTVIPKGSIAMATITGATPKRRLGRGGIIAINIDYLRLPSGEKLAMRAAQQLKGKSHTGTIAASMAGSAATGIFLFPFFFWAVPASPLFLLMHGHEAAIPEGREITAYTNTDYAIPAPTKEISTVFDRDQEQTTGRDCRTGPDPASGLQALSNVFACQVSFSSFQ